MFVNKKSTEKSPGFYHRFRLFYFIYFSSVGCFWPFISLFFKKLGFTGSQIGLLMAVGPMVMILMQPVWGIVNDRTPAGYSLVRFVCVGAICVASGFLIPESYLFYILLMALFSFFSYAIIPMVDTATIQAVKGTQVNYGQIRAWGSLGFCIFSVLVGQISKYSEMGSFYRYLHPHMDFQILNNIGGLAFFIPAYISVMLIAFGLTFTLPKVEKPKQSGRNIGKLYVLLRRPRFLVFLITVFFFMLTMNCNSYFFSLYFDGLKGNTGQLGIALSLAALSEVPVFFFASWLLKRLKPLHLLGIAASTAALRWYLYTLVGNPLMTFPLQFFHAINFGCYYAGAVHFVDIETPQEWKTTGQTIFWAVGYGLSAIIGSLFGGFIIEKWNVIIMYEILSVLALLAAGVFFMIDRIFPKTDSDTIPSVS